MGVRLLRMVGLFAISFALALWLWPAVLTNAATTSDRAPFVLALLGGGLFLALTQPRRRVRPRLDSAPAYRPLAGALTRPPYRGFGWRGSFSGRRATRTTINDGKPEIWVCEEPGPGPLYEQGGEI